MSGSKDSDAKFIEEQLAPFKQYGEDVRYHNWLEMTASARSNDKKEQDKLKKFEKRLLVVAKYRLFVIKKTTFGGSRTLHKVIHLYDLVEIGVTTRNEVVELIYNEREKGPPSTTTLRIKSDDIPALLSTLRDLVRAISFGYSPDSILKFTGFSADTLPPLDHELEPGIAGGVLDIYMAQSSYYRTRPSLEFNRYVQFLVANGITDLDLSHCPGAGPKTDISFEIPTIFASLKFNTYFRSVILRNVQVKNVTESLGNALRYNQTIARVQISHSDEEQSLVALGAALKANPSNVLQVIDLSHNTLYTESVSSLCSAIASLTHGLTVLNLSHCGISSKGIQALFNAFESNFGVSLSIQDLDLSYNKFEELASATFVTWLGHIKGCYALRKLGLANTGVDLIVVGPVLRTLIDLHKLDFSNNKLEKPEVVDELKTFVECTSELNHLDLSGCTLSSEFLEEILTQISKNKKINNLSLNLSDNNFGAKGISAFARVLADSGYLKSLNISHNKLKGKGVAEILVSLGSNQNIQELYIGKNLQGSSDMDDLIRPLLDFLTCHPNLRTLDLSNSGSGKAIFPLLQALATNTTLTTLDISGNQFGDLGASILTDSLTTNATLTSLNLDQSNFSLSGWQALSFVFANNRTLRQLPIPYSELEKAAPSDRKEQLRDLVTRLTLYLQYNSGAPYPPALPFSAPCTTPYETPEYLTPLAHVPGHLRALPAPTQQDNVLEVLNASTSPAYRRTSAPVPLSPASPPYSATSSPDASPVLSSPYANSISPRDNRSYSQPPLPPRFSAPPNSLPPLFAPMPPPPQDHAPISPPPRNNLFAPPALAAPLPQPPSPPQQARTHAPPVPAPPRAPAPPPAPSPPRGGASPPPPPPPPAASAPPSKDRTAVLSDITKFSKHGLKKTTTNDRSAPKTSGK